VLTLLYFEIVSTVALVIGLAVVNIVKPGAGMNVDPATLDAGAVAQYVTAGRGQSVAEFLVGIIPRAQRTPSRDRTFFRSCCFPSYLVWRSTRAAGRSAGLRVRRAAVTRPVRHRRHHHEDGADRRIRRDGGHDRHLRRGTLAQLGKLIVTFYATSRRLSSSCSARSPGGMASASGG